MPGDQTASPREVIERVKTEGGSVRASIFGKIINVQTGAVVYHDAFEQSVFLPPLLVRNIG